MRVGMQTSATFSTGFSSRAIMSNLTFGEVFPVKSKIRNQEKKGLRS